MGMSSFLEFVGILVIQAIIIRRRARNAKQFFLAPVKGSGKCVHQASLC